MKKQILTNVRTDLIFFSRNILLMIIVVIMVIQTLFSIFFGTLVSYLSSVKFENIQSIVYSFNRLVYIIVAALGIIAVFSHNSQRCLKMVFTKPCLPEVWTASLFLSITIVAAILFFLSFVIGSLLFITMDVPYQKGIIFICLEEFCSALIISFFLLMLGLVIHPVLAVFLIFILNESSLYYLYLSISASLENAKTFTQAFFLDISKSIVGLLYMIVPIQNPAEEQFSEVARSWVVLPKDWGFLALFIGYTLIFSVLAAFLSSELLKRKRLI